MRLYLTLFSLLFLIVLDGQSLANYPATHDAQAPKEKWVDGKKAFTVNADVILYVPPDAWVLEIYGTEEAPTIEQARAKMQVRTDAFSRKLQAMGIPASDITITTVGQERISDWKELPNGTTQYTTVAYQLTKSILIRYTDVQLYSKIISEGSLHAFDDVQQNYCTVADEQAVYAELYRQAMEVVMEKQNREAIQDKANVLPGGKVTRETYDVQTPTPGIYVQPGVQRIAANGFDRVIGGEYGNGAVRYTIHLEYSFTLQQQVRTSSPIKIQQ